MGFDLPSPSAVVKTVGAGHRRSSVAHLAAKVRRNVRAPHLALASHLGARGGLLVDGQVAHAAAELIRHDCNGWSSCRIKSR